MIKKFILPLSIFTFLLLTSGCVKDNDDPTDPPPPDPITNADSAKFIGLIDSTEWAPRYLTATYFSKWNELYLRAGDVKGPGSSNSTVQAGLAVDSVVALKKYLLEPHGDNNAQLFNNGYYYSDHNMADAGGSFTLTKFDLVNKRVSGVLQFKGYNYKKTKSITFTSKKIEDIPLTIDTTSNPGNTASCTIAGVVTTNWQRNITIASLGCYNSLGQESLYIDIESLSDYYGNDRSIHFEVPLQYGKGTYLISTKPYISCAMDGIYSKYMVNDYNNMYLPVSGQMTIESIDVANRKLKASFSINYQDTTKGEMINITNGKLNINYWRGRNGQ